MIQIKNKGFTLVELLAVIVILAIILVIAVPKVMSVIEDAKKATLESTAKMIASQAEKQKVQNTVLGNDKAITCKDITNINDVDYASCEISFDNNTAKVTITGGGKFEGLNVCGGTKTNAEATIEECGGETTEQIAPGLYQSGSNYTILLKSWDELLVDGIIHVDDNEVYTNHYYDINKYGASSNHSSDVLEGDLMLPSDGSITRLGVHAFTACEKLTGMIIPSSVTELGEYALSDCHSLTSVGSIGSGADVIIPNSITTLDHTFLDCGSLTSAIIPNSVTIMEGTFSSCENLSSITIPNSVVTIGIDTFSYCYNLLSITIPNSVENIGRDAFSNSNLTSLTIPSSVKTIGSCAFGGNNFTSITFDGTMAQWENIEKYNGDESWPYPWYAATGAYDNTITHVVCDDGTITVE